MISQFEEHFIVKYNRAASLSVPAFDPTATKNLFFPAQQTDISADCFSY